MLYKRSCSTKGAAHASFILSINTNTAEVTVNTDCVTRTFIIDKESQIRAKAKSLKKDALKKSGTRRLNLPINFKERTCSLVVSSLRSETKGSLFESGR